MLAAIGQGILLGLLLSVFVGISFFVLIETSIQYGFKKTLPMSLGIVSSDALILFFIWYISKGYIQYIIQNSYFNLLCSFIFIGFGLYYLTKSNQVNFAGVSGNYKKGRLFLQGVAVNLFNPSVVVFWLGAMLVAISKLTYSGAQLFLYFASALIIVLITDILKIYSASKLKKRLNNKHIRKMNIIIGFLMLAVGIKIFFDITYCN